MWSRERRGRRWLLGAAIVTSAFTLSHGPAFAQDDGEPSDTTTRQPDWPEPTQVAVDFEIQDIPKVDERENLFVVEGYLYVDWFDERQADRPCDDPLDVDYDLYQGDQARERLTTMWWPELEIVDAIGQRAPKTLALLVFCNGFVVYEERFRAQVFQPYDLNDFPFDDHDVSFTIAPVSQYADRVTFAEFEPEEEEDEPFGIRDGGEWIIVSDAFADPLINNIGYASATYEATIKRDATFYVWNMILPLLLIVSISWAVFWMDIAKMTLSDRLTVSLTSLLTVVAFDFLTNNDLPRLTYSTRLDNLYIASCLFVASTVVMSVIAEIRAKNDDEGSLRRVRAQDRVSRYVFPVAYGVTVAAVLFGPGLGPGA